MTFSKIAQITATVQIIATLAAHASTEASWRIKFDWKNRANRFSRLKCDIWEDYTTNQIVRCPSGRPRTGKWNRMLFDTENEKDPKTENADSPKRYLSLLEATRNLLEKAQKLGFPSDIAFKSIRIADSIEYGCHKMTQVCSDMVNGSVYILQYDYHFDKTSCASFCAAWLPCGCAEPFVRISLVKLPPQLYKYDSRITNAWDPKWPVSHPDPVPISFSLPEKVTNIETHLWLNDRSNQIGSELTLPQLLYRLCTSSVRRNLKSYNPIACCTGCSAIGCANCVRAASVFNDAMLSQANGEKDFLKKLSSPQSKHGPQRNSFEDLVLEHDLTNPDI